jgi:hypothetical protein
MQNGERRRRRKQQHRQQMWPQWIKCFDDLRKVQHAKIQTSLNGTILGQKCATDNVERMGWGGGSMRRTLAQNGYI